MFFISDGCHGNLLFRNCTTACRDTEENMPPTDSDVVEIRLRDDQDYTIYYPLDEGLKVQASLARASNKEAGNGPSCESFDCRHALEGGEEARVIGCWSYGQKYFSVTVRRNTGGAAFFPVIDKSGYTAPGSCEDYLVSIRTLCESLHKAIFVAESGSQRDDINGLVVLSGSTGVAKSIVATGLIYEYLRRIKKYKRTPHLVTYEDPIERPWWKDPPNDPSSSIDYTPRLKDRDARGLKQVLQDARRQTPSAVFIGEIRKRSEWKAVFDFAGSGHLVVTTTHAGSLTEGMTNLFKAMNCKTPADRERIGSRLQALVHLERHEIRHPKEDKQMPIALPTLWRRMPASVMALVSDGCASLLPHRRDRGTLGRRWYAEAVVDQIKNEYADYKNNLLRRAIEKDLVGL